ncbi:hypothetical protein [Haloferula sp. BvORR071]|uniref:hypothetical protein n=1 Tax=Haloferula sp. BvORR071 TaxID=1396141 RepID=UPI000552738D|nr:hypothetical protein [Haloferula sp. BvORR071]
MSEFKGSSDFEIALGSSLQPLGKIPLKAVQDYIRLYSQVAPAHSKRSQASLIHDHMIDWAGRILPAEFRRIDVRQRILFNFKDEYLIQFNKLEANNRRACNNTSQQSLLFEETGEVGLPGIRAVLPLVTIGYVTAQDGVSIEGVFAVRIIDGTPDWIIRLDDREDGEGTNQPIPLPHAPSTPSPRIKRPRPESPDVREFGSGES